MRYERRNLLAKIGLAWLWCGAASLYAAMPMMAKLPLRGLEAVLAWVVVTLAIVLAIEFGGPTRFKGT
jgi:uncharacterized membrane protein